MVPASCSRSSGVSALVMTALAMLQVAASTADLPEAPRRLEECSTDNSSDWLMFFSGGPYLQLPEIDNWSRSNGNVETVWDKLKLHSDPQIGDTSVTIDLQDYTYAVTDGQGERVEWGTTKDCRGPSASGTMRINLQGTPFKYEAALPAAVGYLSHGSVTCDSAGQYCNASCGGYCGFCGLGIPGEVKTAELEVIDQCAFNKAIEAWATTTTQTTTSSYTSSSSTSSFLGNTTTKTSTLSTSGTRTSATLSTTTMTTATVSTTSTTQVNGYHYYRFTPTQIADESATGACCCAHAVSEIYFRNCGQDVELTFVDVRNVGGTNSAGEGPEMAIDHDLETKWRDSSRQPLVFAMPGLTPVDEYSYVTAKDCAASDPIAFELHGSQDGVYWEILDSHVMDVAPPASTWRPAQTDWFSFKNCTPTTTSTSRTRTATQTTSWTRSRTLTATQTTTASLTSSSSTISMTMTSTTTSADGVFVSLVKDGSCVSSKLFPILGPAECDAAAKELGLLDTTAEVTANANRPEGCYFYEGLTLWLGMNPHSKGNGAETSGPLENMTRYPICSSRKSVERGVATASSGAYDVGRSLQTARALALLAMACYLQRR